MPNAFGPRDAPHRSSGPAGSKAPRRRGAEQVDTIAVDRQRRRRGPRVDSPAANLSLGVLRRSTKSPALEGLIFPTAAASTCGRAPRRGDGPAARAVTSARGEVARVSEIRRRRRGSSVDAQLDPLRPRDAPLAPAFSLPRPEGSPGARVRPLGAGAQAGARVIPLKRRGLTVIPETPRIHSARRERGLGSSSYCP